MIETHTEAEERRERRGERREGGGRGGGEEGEEGGRGERHTGEQLVSIGIRQAALPLRGGSGA